MKKVKILIGVPLLGWSHEFASSFIKFWTSILTHNTLNYEVAYEFKHRRPIDLAEEELADDAIATGCTHLLLMDDDVYDVTVSDLQKLVTADKDVIGGIMHAGGFPYAMCAFRRYDRNTSVASQPRQKGALRLYEVPPEQQHGIQPVDLIPFAFTLFKTSVFKHVPKPWFKYDKQTPTDSYFADTVLNAGMDYFAHFDVWVNHRGITRETRREWYNLGMKKNEASMLTNNNVIHIDGSTMQRHESYMRLKMANAEKERLKHDSDKIAGRFHSLNNVEVLNG